MAHFYKSTSSPSLRIWGHVISFQLQFVGIRIQILFARTALGDCKKVGLIKRFPYKTRKLVGCQDLNGYFVPQKPSWASTSHRERSPSSKRHSCSCTVSPRTVQVRCSWASRPRWKPCSCCGGSCWSQSRRSLRGRVNRIRKCSSTARRHQLSRLFCIKWCISSCLWNFNCIKPLA